MEIPGSGGVGGSARRLQLLVADRGAVIPHARSPDQASFLRRVESNLNVVTILELRSPTQLAVFKTVIIRYGP